jgi:membrane protease YdiL (CAAX protease family)
VYLGIQLVLLVGVVVVTAFDGLHFHGVTTFTLYVPIWTEASDWAGRMGEQYLSREWVGGPYQALANPMRYALLPLVFLLPLTGARYLGLGRGHRVVRVMALWCALPLIIAATFLFLGQSTLVGFGKRLVSNTLQNGPFEEFLFRGAIQTRLTALLGPAWGLTLSSLAFGVWHLGLGYTMMGKQSVADGLAVTVLIQTVTGVGFGYLFHRTRNLMAGSVFHVVSNSAV